MTDADTGAGRTGDDVGPEARPDGYAHLERRADGDWGVSIRGFNNTGVWHNGEGWELDHALRTVRAWFPWLVIHVKPDDELPLVVIAPDEPLGSAADWR